MLQIIEKLKKNKEKMESWEIALPFKIAQDEELPDPSNLTDEVLSDTPFRISDASGSAIFRSVQQFSVR